MASQTTVQLKRSSVAGKVPDSANVEVGEPVINLADKKVYTKNGSGNVIQIASGNLQGLADVSNATPLSNQVLAWNGVIWAPANVQSTSGVDSVNGLTGVITLTTTDIAEGGNLYYTDSRVYSNVNQIGYITSSSLNGYATNSQLDAYALDVDLTTANVTELTNLYYTNARVYANVTPLLDAKANLTGATFTGNVIATNLLPPTDDTGTVGDVDRTWNNGHFTNLSVDTLGSISGTLNVRTALDLGDDDPIRFGDNDDLEIYHDGTNSYIDINSGNLVFRDVVSNRATFVRNTGDFNTIGNVSAAFFIGDGSQLSNVSGTGGGGTITFSSTEPASPSVGDRWVNDDGVEFVYFDDGTSIQWVDFNSNFSLPTQTGNSGKYLITNGNTPSWTTLTIAGATGSSFSNSQILSGILDADASALRVGSGSLVFNTGPTINSATLNNPSVVNANISGNLTVVNGNITGTVFATTPDITANTTQIATTAFVQNLVNGTNSYFTSTFTSGVSAGTYGNSIFIPSVVVDTTGRVTSASNVSLQTGVTPGAYGNATLIPTLTVDSTGRITAASNVSIVGGATLADANLLSSSTFYPTLSSSNTGSYTTATVSVSRLYFVPNTGTLSATTFNSLSDLNLKTNVRVIENGLNLLEPLIPVSFNWKDTGIHSFGLIAQEIEKIYPELVCTNDLGVKSVAYSPIIAMLISAIKELKQEIDELKGK